MTPGRRCYVCRERDGGIHRRVFLPRGAPDQTPRCEQHGPMKLEQNKPYRGTKT